MAAAVSAPGHGGMPKRRVPRQSRVNLAIVSSTVSCWNCFGHSLEYKLGDWHSRFDLQRNSARIRHFQNDYAVEARRHLCCGRTDQTLTTETGPSFDKGHY